MKTYLHYTKGPRPFILKVGAVGYSHVLYKTVRIYETNEVTTGSVTPNTLAGGLIVYILLFYVHDNAFASHRSPMTIYIKSRGSGL